MARLRPYRYGIFVGGVRAERLVAATTDPAGAIERARLSLLYHADRATDACVVETGGRGDLRLLFWCRLSDGALSDLYRAEPREPR